MSLSFPFVYKVVNKILVVGEILNKVASIRLGRSHPYVAPVVESWRRLLEYWS